MTNENKPWLIAFAILMICICDIFFIGGAVLLCVYKNWSCWTIFFSIVLGTMCTSGILKTIGIKTDD